MIPWERANGLMYVKEYYAACRCDRASLFCSKPETLMTLSGELALEKRTRTSFMVS